MKKLFYSILFYSILFIFSPICVLCSVRFNVKVKYPFPSILEVDTLTIVDSFSVGTVLNLKITRNDGSVLSLIDTTTDSGAVFIIDKWSDGKSFYPYEIEKIDIELPNAEKVSKIGEEIICEPVKFLSVPLKKTEEETIVIQLPLGTTQRANEWIGPEDKPVIFKFVIITDLHIGEGERDFEGGGWWSPWRGTDGGRDAPNHIAQVRAVLNMINYLILNGEDIRFVAVLGDISESAERSEFERARSLLDSLLVPYIPVFGNHDTWPYHNEWWGGVNEQNRNDVIIGKYFMDYGFKSYYNETISKYPLSNFTMGSYLTSYIYIPTWDINSYFVNCSFDCQNYHFIIADFNSREEAWFGGGTLGNAEIHQPQWNWFWNKFDVSLNENRKIIVFNHHPLKIIQPERTFSFAEYAMKMFDQALDARGFNVYFEYWFAGHTHNNEHLTGDWFGDIISNNIVTAEAGTGWYRVFWVRGDKKDIHIAMDPNSNGMNFIFYPDVLTGSNTSNSFILKFGDGSEATGSGNFLINHSYPQKGVYKIEFDGDYQGRHFSISKLLMVPQISISTPQRNTNIEPGNLQLFNLTFEAPEINYLCNNAVFKANINGVWNDIGSVSNSSNNNPWTIQYCNLYWTCPSHFSPEGVFNDTFVIIFSNNSQLYSYSYRLHIPFKIGVNAPSNFYALPLQEPYRIKLTWTKNSNIAIGYEIKKVWNGDTTIIPINDVNTTSYIDNDVSLGVLYTYYIRAYDNAGHYSD